MQLHIIGASRRGCRSKTSHTHTHTHLHTYVHTDLKNLSKDSIKQPVTKADFDEALSKIHTSVGADDIAKHRKWMQEFGAT